MPCYTNVSDLIGIPFAPHGRDENGIDCFGLILIIAQRNGTPIKDVWYKGFDPKLITLADQMAVHTINNCETGCIIEMEKEGRLHLGYALGNDQMIHATINEGVVIDPVGKYPIKGFWEFDNGNCKCNKNY